MGAILCFLFGHRWSEWQPTYRVDVWTNAPDPSSRPLYTTNAWAARFRARGHVEHLGFDLAEQPFGVISGR